MTDKLRVLAKKYITVESVVAFISIVLVILRITNVIDWGLTVSSIATVFIAFMMWRTASHAQETEKQKRRPRVMFDFVFEKRCVYAEIRNEGLVSARNINFIIPPDIIEAGRHGQAEFPFKHPISSLSPSDKKRSLLMPSGSFFETIKELEFVIKVSYEDDRGNSFPLEEIPHDLTYAKNISELGGVDIGQQVEKIEKTLGRLEKISSRIAGGIETLSKSSYPSSDEPCRLSKNALTIAEWLIKQSKTGMKFDPRPSIEELTNGTCLPKNNVLEGVNELGESGFVTYRASQVIAEESLFIKFDRFWMDWDTEGDAKRLAKDILEDKDFTSGSEELDEQDTYKMKQINLVSENYDLPSRRLNPALCWLETKRIITIHRALGTDCIIGFQPTTLRRFVKKYTIDTSSDHKNDKDKN